MQNDKFQRFILSSQHNAMCQRFTSMLHQGVSRCSSDSIVFNNAKRKWQIIDTKWFLTWGFHRFIGEILQGAKRGGKFEYFKSKIETKNSIVPKNLNWRIGNQNTLPTHPTQGMPAIPDQGQIAYPRDLGHPPSGSAHGRWTLLRGRVQVHTKFLRKSLSWNFSIK